VSSDEHGPITPSRNRTLDLISAVAAGEAEREDIVAELKSEGIDSLDVLVDVLAQATQKAPRNRVPPCLRDPQQLSNETPADLLAKIVHPVPRLPFLLRGALYDPSDIARFNGQELHFISSGDKSHIIAIDDRAVIERWWQFSFVSANLKTFKANESGMSTTGSWRPGGDIGGGYLGTSPTFDLPKLGLGGTRGAPYIRTTFFEDINFRGSDIELEPGLGYPDLTKVSWTFLGTGDWNDTISSVRLDGTELAMLYEHVNWGGSTFSTTHEPNLTTFGWNDRASGCATW
jgi:hypothetical protein